MIARKQSAFAIGDLPGLWRFHWRVNQQVILSTFYTRHDQACLLWAIVSAAIFITAQFLPMSWYAQAILASGLTLLSVMGMVMLTWYFTSAEGLTWLLYCWSFLMAIGMLITDLSFLLQWGQILGQICPLWLALSGAGYMITGVGMRSRAFLLIGIVHLLAIGILPAVGMWQPLITGIIISGSTLLVAEVQWDSHGVCGNKQITEPERIDLLHESGGMEQFVVEQVSNQG
ncbi:hypothetical protein IFO70_18185 [Phormidium tenue FACHB-886]|nr:hypothetical protein [Phormidium tenue FACHB-886]